MKIGQTAKSIDTIVNSMQYDERPAYYDARYEWNYKQRKWNIIDGKCIARKYTQIIELVKDTNAKVKVQGNTLKIIYSANGYATIPIDELVTKILIPELKQFITTD